MTDSDDSDGSDVLKEAEETDKSDGVNEGNGGRENPLQSILSGARWVMGGRIIKMAVVFLAQVVVARILGVSFFGGLAQANAVAGVVGLVGALGVGTGVSRQLAYHEDDPQKARGLIRAGFVIGILGTGTAAVALYLAAPFLARNVFQDATLTVLFRVVAIGIPFGFLGNLGVSMGKAARDASVHTYVNQILTPLTNSAFRVGAAVLGLGVVGVVTGSVLAKAVTGVVALYLAWRSVPFSLRGPARSMYLNLTTFSLPLLFASGFNFLIGDIDTFLIGILSSSGDVGLYTAVFGLRPLVLVFFFPATYLLPPVLTRLQKEERPADARRTYTAISKWTTLISFPLFLPLFLFPKLVIGLTYGGEYVTPAAALVLQLFAVSMLVNVALGANDRAVVALGHNQTTMYVAAVAAGANLVLNALLIPRYGIIGAGIASALAFASRDVINSVLLYRWHGLVPLSASQLRALSVAGVLSAIGYLVFVRVFPETFLWVVAVGIVFLTVYIPLIVRLGVRESIDQELYNQIEESQSIDLTPLRQTVDWIRSY